MQPHLSILIGSPAFTEHSCLAEQIQTEFAAKVTFKSNPLAILEELRSTTCQLLMADISTPEINLAFLKEVRHIFPDLLILPLIPATHRQLVQHLLDLDIHHYLLTPLEPAEVTITLGNSIEHLQRRNSSHNTTVALEQSSFHGIIGQSRSMTELFDLITRVAEDGVSTVLIRGESGTGKEMVAKAIHAQSARNGNIFVPVNCAAIPDDLLESELFGYTKGAFTGASTNKVGRIQYADGGTLFLDEIGDMKPSLQAKLLRVLQEKEFEPVGALKPVPVDTRIVAATHCDLEKLVNEGTFREDLYYRLSVIPLKIPALKDRREDIPLLAENFINLFTIKRNRDPFTFSPKAMAALLRFEWCGNVRELENLIQHMSVLYSGKNVDFDDLPDKFFPLREEIESDPEFAQLRKPIPQSRVHTFSQSAAVRSVEDIPWHKGKIDFRELINNFETDLIVHAMKLTEGNKKEAARLLNLKRTTLLEKIKKKALNKLWQESN